ncbi:alpha/beta hydrolase family protein [Nocardioides sp. URHA0020]|uniref:alpha/beta hydrolase family protein n=1 Tax=Nocardioides sp. URHA0020 TaxID=1380392 RepID=UPI00048E1951|nr:alpha/beta family hydrolase [Nocardioides sp. URHA0020]
MTAVERRFETPHGDARIVVRQARGPVATLLLSHGAGGGIDSRDLVALAEHLPRNGVTVVLLEQPWKVAGRKIATPPATLDVGLVAAANRLKTRTPLVVGGRSAGARSAARCAKQLGASGCLALAFPLHPPGKPEKSRLEELRAARVPTLVVQGERDAFGRPDEFPSNVDLAVVPAADHGFKVPARAEVSEADAMGIIVESTLEWILREVTGTGSQRE